MELTKEQLDAILKDHTPSLTSLTCGGRLSYVTSAASSPGSGQYGETNEKPKKPIPEHYAQLGWDAYCSRLFFDPRPGIAQVWMNGGGTQSAAIAALVCMGELPKPNLAVISDTGRERGTTWKYLDEVIRPAMERAGVQVWRISKADWSPVDLTCRRGTSIIMPGFTTAGGSVGMLPNRCSGEWKRDVCRRWLRNQGIKDCDVWYGISRDEDHRAGGLIRRSPKWMRPIFPLLAKRMTRRTCVAVVRMMKWPTPPRSRCWQCPYQSDSEWAELRRDAPEEFAKAAELQRTLSKLDQHFWLHKSCKPLEEIDFASDDDPLLLGGCESGMCFT